MTNEAPGGLAVKFAAGFAALAALFAIFAHVTRPSPAPVLRRGLESEAGSGLPAPVAQYHDEFLSTELWVRVTGTSLGRSLPTTNGTAVLVTRYRNQRLVGRWVRGVDGRSRWLRAPFTENDGRQYVAYFWDGNLAAFTRRRR